MSPPSGPSGLGNCGQGSRQEPGFCSEPVAQSEKVPLQLLVFSFWVPIFSDGPKRSQRGLQIRESPPVGPPPQGLQNKTTPGSSGCGSKPMGSHVWGRGSTHFRLPILVVGLNRMFTGANRFGF